MPLVNLKLYIEDARKNNYALGCFNAFNMETLDGIIKAAEDLNSPVICAIYEPHFKFGNLEQFSVLVREAAGKTSIPVIMHLEYASDLSSVINAIKWGFGSVMFVGREGMNFEEKIEQIKKAADISHSAGLLIESEISEMVKVKNHAVTGSSNQTGVAGKTFLSKEEMETNNANTALEFIRKTSIDILSPDIGSVHGMVGSQKATLNLDLLKEIRSGTDCYLSLHGGSGVDDIVVKAAINIGLNKMSVYSKNANYAIERIKKYLDTGSKDLTVLTNEIRIGFREMVTDRLKVFGSSNRSENTLKGYPAYLDDDIDVEKLITVLTETIFTEISKLKSNKKNLLNTF
jgi:ketose-bisphosphate aldolase